jgi:hypothetical protein
MANTWQILYRGLAYPVGILACLSLAAPTNAVAGDALNSQPPAPAIAQQLGSTSIVALVADLERQIAEDAPATSDTIVNILTLLPNAPLSDAKLVLTMPSQFAKRAREAAAAGRLAEANRFAALGDVLGELVNGMAPKDAGPQTPPKAEPPPARASGSLSIAAAPVLSPSDLANVEHAPIGNGHAKDASTTSPPSWAAKQSQPPAELAGRASNSHPDAAPANAVAGDALNNRPPAPATGSVSIAALLTKLEKQTAEDHLVTAKEIDGEIGTIVDILALLLNASSSDAQLVLTMPSQFAKRAGEAVAAGRYDEANRFAALGDVLGELLSRMAPKGAGQRAAPSSEPSIAAAPVLVLGDLASVDHAATGNAHAQDASMTSPPNPAAFLSQPPPVLAERASDSHPKMAVRPDGVAAMPPPLKPAESSPPLKLTTNRLAPSDTAKPSPARNLRTALREAPPATTGSNAKSPFAGILNPAESAARPRMVPKAPALPAVPPPTNPATAMANGLDPQCRAIVLKFEIGEEASDAERSYLRHGCRPRG